VGKILLLGILGVILISAIYFLGYKQILNPVKTPAWITNQIKENEISPSSVERCMYNNQAVYYFDTPHQCCDLQSFLYDSDGKYICSPSGGFAGTGDGLCKDFFNIRKGCKVIWTDTH